MTNQKYTFKKLRIEHKTTEPGDHRILDENGNHIGTVHFERDMDDWGVQTWCFVDDFATGERVWFDGIGWYEGAKRAARHYFERQQEKEQEDNL